MRLLSFVLVSLVCGLSSLGSLGCYEGSRWAPGPSPKFQQLQVISSYPATRAPDGAWTRMCGVGQADGLITNIGLLSSQRGRSSNGVLSDHDVSVRPGDTLDYRRVDSGHTDDILIAGTASLSLGFDCINPASTSGNDCSDGVVPYPTGEAETRYHANTAKRSAPHNIMLLIDMSSTMHTPATTPPTDPFGAGVPNEGADPSNQRLESAKRLISILNENDKIGVLPFGVPNSIALPVASVAEDLTSPGLGFGPPDFEKRSPAIDALTTRPAGRSNLWAVVKAAYEFLRYREQEPGASNHIIVISGGPDLCTGENRLTCTTPCSTADLPAFLDQVQVDQADPAAPKIQLDFVQFESLDHPGRDARQVELACETGGHYQYINSNAFRLRDLPAAFAEALDTAVANVRFSLMGHWEVATVVPQLRDEVPPGGLYGLQGAVVLRGTSKLVASDKTFPFGVGQGLGATSATNWDRRPTLRKPCGGFADCGATSAPGACSVVCSPETLTCVDGAAAVAMPDLAACDSGGFCCGGDCLTSGNCAACNVP